MSLSTGKSARGVGRDRDVTLADSAGRRHVFLGVAPDVADNVIDREARLGSGLDCHRVHHAPTAQDHPLRLVALDLEPLRLLLIARVRHFEVFDLEAVLLREDVEDWDRLFSVGGAVVERDDLLAAQLLGIATRALAEVVDDRRYLAVGVELQREDVRKHAAIGRVRAAVVDRDDRILVGGRSIDQRVGDAYAERIERSRRCVVEALLEPLVALDSALDHVLGLALRPGELHAVHAVVARVHALQVVDEASEEPGATRGVRAHAVAL
jgi:hypothetical protein